MPTSCELLKEKQDLLEEEYWRKVNLKRRYGFEV